MAKIYAPNKRFTGVSASVNFVNGVGETNDPHLINWFKSKGYKVENEKKTKIAEPKAEPKTNTKSASKTKTQTTNKK